MKRGFFIALTAVACSSGGGHNPAFIAGFDPPAPAMDQIQIISPIWKDIAPGSDVTYCSYVANPIGRDVDIVDASAFQSQNGHHILLMAVGEDSPFQPGDTHPCTDEDMNKARYITANGSDFAGKLEIPPGIGFRVSARAKLLIQSHWINTTSRPIEGQAAFNVTAKDPSPERQLAGLMAVVGTQFDVRPHTMGWTQSECTFPRDVQAYMLTGHAHEWGASVKIERVGATASEVLYEQPWAPEYAQNPPKKTFPLATPLKIAKGERIRVTCTWNNTTDADLVFPKEMCAAVGLQFPTMTDITCADGKWQESL
jgi:hypothetical protein